MSRRYSKEIYKKEELSLSMPYSRNTQKPFLTDGSFYELVLSVTHAK